MIYSVHVFVVHAQSHHQQFLWLLCRDCGWNTHGTCEDGIVVTIITVSLTFLAVTNLLHLLIVLLPLLPVYKEPYAHIPSNRVLHRCDDLGVVERERRDADFVFCHLDCLDRQL